MKHLPLLTALFLFPQFLSAHDHVEIGLDPSNPSKLKIVATPPAQLATYFPTGEAPSYDTPGFPGKAYATVLTFSAFDNAPPPPNGALVRIDLVAVSGPAGGAFSFWEIGASTPTWQRSSGWNAAPSDQPFLFASEDSTGYGHIHGRAFSFNRAGTYDITFRAVDTTGAYQSSDPIIVRFTAIDPPQLSISSQAGSIHLTFASRADLVYDVQSSTTLQPNSWTTIDTLDGTGGLLDFSEPLNNRPRVFYRLVEYQ